MNKDNTAWYKSKVGMFFSKFFFFFVKKNNVMFYV